MCQRCVIFASISEVAGRGESVHAKSRLFHSIFRSSAESEFRRSLLLTQQNSVGTFQEVNVYEDWQRTIPEFLKSQASKEESVQRLNRILQESARIRQAVSDCQIAVRDGDFKRLKSLREGLESDEASEVQHEHLNDLKAQLIAETLRLEYLHSIANEE